VARILKMVEIKNNLVFLVFLFIVAILCITIWYILFVWKRPAIIHINASGGGKCSSCSSSGGKLDPIFDPRYNMKEVIKQSILLEQHLCEKPKRCKECISKHFLLVIGLTEEAVSLAGTNIEAYPHIRESCIFYNQLFKKWLEVKTMDLFDERSEKTIMEIPEELRKQRKLLMAEYIK
jgi:hypothetical protein